MGAVLDVLAARTDLVLLFVDGASMWFGLAASSRQEK